MSRKVRLRKTVNIGADLAVNTNANRNTTFSVNYVNFFVHDVIVKQITYNSAVDTKVYQLWSDLVREGVLCTFSTGTSTNLDTIFTFNSTVPAGQQYRFQVQEVPNGCGIGPVTTNASGQYNIVLEFVQYED